MVVFTAAVTTGQRLAHSQSKNIIVFAAASLKFLLDEVGAAFRRETGNRVIVSYEASSTLAKQIENGASADLFISADPEWMDYLEQRKLIKAWSRSNLLGNRLVLIAPAFSRARLVIEPGFSLTTALGNGRLAMADPAEVPAGIYGKAALEALGIWPAVANRVAIAKDVRAALLMVARREAPLGIVYATDAAFDPGVRVVGTFPEETHPQIIYPVALTSTSDNPAASTRRPARNSRRRGSESFDGCQRRQLLRLHRHLAGEAGNPSFHLTAKRQRCCEATFQRDRRGVGTRSRMACRCRKIKATRLGTLIGTHSSDCVH